MPSSIALAVALLAGCADEVRDPPGSSTPYGSGSRLRAIVLDSGDGAVARVGWRDLALDAECLFRVAADDVWRCVPATSGVIVYRDAACTEPVAASLQGGCDPPTWAHEWLYTPDRCDANRTAVYAVGAPLGRAEVYARSALEEDAGACFHRGAVETFEVGAPADPSGFVAAEATGESRGNRLGVTLVTATDGAHQIIDTIDLGHGSCRRTRLSTGEEVCVRFAHPGGLTGGFIDDACTQPVPAANLGCRAEPPAGVFVGDVLHLVGARLGGPVFHRPLGSEACTLTTRTGHEVGRVATAGDFPPMAEVLEGTGRLHGRWSGDRAGRPLTFDGFVDTEHDRACRVVRLDGEPDAARCAVYDVLARPALDGDEWFADPGCTEPVLWGSHPSELEGKVLAGFGCGEFLQSLSTAKLHEGAVYQRDRAGACVESDLPDVSEVPFVVDTVLPLDALPRLARRTE